VTSSPLRHQNNITKIFPFWAPPNQNFWLLQWSWVNNLMVFKKVVLVLKEWSWSWPDQCLSRKNRWSWSCNLVVLLHHWYILYGNLSPIRLFHSISQVYQFKKQ